ncbi:MAG TPA: TIR domain-containing protein [Thermoanaerobaculia bacterium]|nr:TIR domain-containing protein [Thermoanaerobaculia bacterium]
MSFEFDVFVSYSRRDSTFVEGLVGMMRDAGFKVWLDVEQVPGGADVNASLLKALDACRHVVAVITENWLASDYTTWEVSASHQDLREERILVPLARMAFDARRLGPFLHRRNVLSWLEGDPDPDSRFWEVYCALLQKAPGPKTDWGQNGRAARKASGGSALIAATAATAAEREARTVHRARWGPGRAVLGCDRAPQWNQICAHADKLQHEALFVVGPRGEGHELFLETLYECFPASPLRHTYKVLWSPAVPSSRGVFRAELAEALDCGEAELAGAMRSHLRDQNLVLVHRPVLAARLRDEALIGYYTRWLPELMTELGSTTGVIKVVQGIDWCAAPKLTGGLARFASRLGIGGQGWVEEALQQDEAARALERIRKEADAERMPVVLLEPLRPITRQEVETWSESLPPGVDRAEIVRDALSGANDSADILRKIVDRLGA